MVDELKQFCDALLPMNNDEIGAVRSTIPREQRRDFDALRLHCAIEELGNAVTEFGELNNQSLGVMDRMTNVIADPNAPVDVKLAAMKVALCFPRAMTNSPDLDPEECGNNANIVGNYLRSTPPVRE